MSLLQKHKKHPNIGLCYLLARRGCDAGIMLEYVKECWPEHSGALNFPIPCPKLSNPVDAYVWPTPKFLAKRAELAAFIDEHWDEIYPYHKGGF